MASLGRLVDPDVELAAGPLVVRICLDVGQRAWAQAVVEQVGALSPDPVEPALLRAMVLHEADRLDAARTALAPVVRGSASCHVITTAVGARLLAAAIELRRGAATPAHELLAAAVELASDEGVVRPFLPFASALELLAAGRGTLRPGPRWKGSWIGSSTRRRSSPTPGTRPTG